MYRTEYMKPAANYTSTAIRCSSRGYTLMELVVYVAVFALLSVVVVNAILSVAGTFLVIRAERNVNTTANTALERVVRETRLAIGVDTFASTFGAHPGRLTLNTTDTNGIAATVEFYIENGTLKVRENGVDAGALTPSTVAIDTFIMRFITVGSVQAVKIELTLHDTRGGTARSFYNTALLRGSY